jgi:hypothetical protein
MKRPSTQSERSMSWTRIPTCLRPSRLVVLLVLTSLALAACGAPGSPGVANGGSITSTTVGANGGGTAPGSSELAFSQCMRSNDIPNFPDPSSAGVIPKKSLQQLGVSESRFQRAQGACRHLLPNGGSGPSQAQVAQVTALGLQFALCMRSHGVPLPDPDSSGRIPDPATVGITQGSPKFEAANQACGKYRPPYMPSNAQYNAYVRSLG